MAGLRGGRGLRGLRRLRGLHGPAPLAPSERVCLTCADGGGYAPTARPINYQTLFTPCVGEPGYSRHGGRPCCPWFGDGCNDPHCKGNWWVF